METRPVDSAGGTDRDHEALERSLRIQFDVLEHRLDMLGSRLGALESRLQAFRYGLLADSLGEQLASARAAPNNLLKGPIRALIAADVAAVLVAIHILLTIRNRA